MRSNHHLALLALALSVTILVAALYGYMEHEIDVSTGRAILARDIIRVEAADKTQEQGLTALYSSTAADRARVEGLFIPVSASVSFIEAVEAIGPQSGSSVTLSSIAADDLSASIPGTLGSIRGQVSARGSWPSVMRALVMAESLPYVVSVSGIHMDSSAVTGTGPVQDQWSLAFGIQAQMIAGSSTPPSSP
jgi:hypothetical protein